MQARRVVGESNDASEKEADRIAAAVLGRGAQLGATAAPPSVQRSPGVVDSRDAGAPRIVDRVVDAAGEPLDDATRAFFEPRFGHDFRHVRVHRDEQAARSAQAVSAHAYTVGGHIAFAAGNYAPHTPAGQTLLAHELVHTIQQGPGGAQVQRDEEAKPAATKVDVALLLGSDDIDAAEGRAYAGTVLRVTSAKDAREQLDKLNRPIGTIYVISHSNRAGEVQFESGIGTVSWVKIADLAAELKSAKQKPDAVDFRGCKLGEAGAELESFRSEVGATSVRATNCWSFTQRVTPLTINDTPITKPEQVPEKLKASFDTLLLKQVNGMKAANGSSVKNCLVGLPSGAKIDKSSIEAIKTLYWSNEGRLVASWASPEFNENWQEGSLCTKDLTGSTKPCGIVEKKAPAKQGALPVEAPAERYALDAGPDSEEPAA